jgi:hypothetical protein
MVIRTIDVYLVAIMLLASCSTGKEVAGSIDPPARQAQPAGNQILAVVIKASAAPGGKVNFELVQASLNGGKLKPGQQKNTGNDLQLAFVDADLEPVTEVQLLDPLNERMEYVDDNDELGTTTIRRDSGYISVRTNYQPAIKYVVIKRNSPSDTSKTIFPLKNL